MAKRRANGEGSIAGQKSNVGQIHFRRAFRFSSLAW